MSDKKPLPILPKETPSGKDSSGEKRLIKLLDKANSLPNASGCYFMKGKNGEILYVGKAKKLKSRVKSYFANGPKSPKTEILVGHIRDFDFILTQTETESFILENNLIKEHKPKYNILLKDDKTYPYLLVNYAHDFPRLEYVRRPKRRKHHVFFGPFPVGSNISRILRVLTKALKLRDCSNHEFNSRTTPCILHQMKQCSAPCVGLIDESEYDQDIQRATQIFQNKKKRQETMEYLTEQMMNAAQEEDFEQAAMLRDFIQEIDEFTQKSYDQNVESLSESNTDIIAYYLGEEEVDISLYLVRQGNLIGHKNFHFLKADFIDEVENEIFIAVLQYYNQNNEVIPERIIVDFSKEKASELESSLLGVFGEGVKFKVYSRTKKYESLLDSTRNHAKESQSVRIKNQDSVYVGLNRLKDLLNLKARPQTLECYDIAIWQGKSPTAAQITFYEGKPEKAGYRHYHLQELPEGNNDFAMMREVFERRLKYENFPDVFIVDGGVQQVNTVKKVLEELDIEVPVIGIAKARDLKTLGFRADDIKQSDERLVIPGRANPFILNKCLPLMRIVVHMRDEAHRFSRRLHHKAEKKRTITSWVDNVKGLNDSVRKQVLSNMTLSFDELKNLNLTGLQRILGINQKHARIIYDYLHAE